MGDIYNYVRKDLADTVSSPRVPASKTLCFRLGSYYYV